MSYYWFNEKVLLQKAKGGYHKCGGKEKATKYYVEKKEALKKMQKEKEKEKEEKTEYGEDRYKKNEEYQS